MVVRSVAASTSAPPMRPKGQTKMYIPARPARVRLIDMLRLIRNLVEHSVANSLVDIRRSGSLVASPFIMLFVATVLLIVGALLIGVSIQHILTDIATVALLGGLLTAVIRRQTEQYHIPQVLPQPDPAFLREMRMLRESQQWQCEVMQLVHMPTRDELQRTAQQLTIAITNSTLMEAQQQQLLEMLAILTGLRVTALEQTEWRDQQHNALATLWEIVGLIQIPGRIGLDTLRCSVERLARALDLEWIALLAPNDVSPVAPVLVADRRPERGPTLHPTHLRIAAEAIRKGQPLVRSEAQACVACMPILQAGMAPLVVVARGAADEESTQSILLLLGDLLARRFERVPVN